jgi:hypothetical protein
MSIISLLQKIAAMNRIERKNDPYRTNRDYPTGVSLNSTGEVIFIDFTLSAPLAFTEEKEIIPVLECFLSANARRNDFRTDEQVKALMEKEKRQ